jgi:hypothetical protein
MYCRCIEVWFRVIIQLWLYFVTVVETVFIKCYIVCFSEKRYQWVRIIYCLFRKSLPPIFDWLSPFVIVTRSLASRRTPDSIPEVTFVYGPPWAQSLTPRSPDLTACDFFFMGVPKNRSTRNNPSPQTTYSERDCSNICQYAARGHAKLPGQAPRMHTFKWKTFGGRNIQKIIFFILYTKWLL